MGSLVLGTVGAVIGASFGAPQVGYALGSAIGGALFPEAVKDGPRITDLKVQNSQFGSPIPIVYGSFRLAGQLIWATKLVEHPDQTDSGSGGGGGTNYTYTCSFAISICERNDISSSSLRRMWADGKLIYDATVVPAKVGFIASKPIKFYEGLESQLPDSTMEAELGVGNVPAYRGQVYVVFTDLELGKFGNRLPNLTFEVLSAGSRMETTQRFPTNSNQGGDTLVYNPLTDTVWSISSGTYNGSTLTGFVIYSASSGAPVGTANANPPNAPQVGGMESGTLANPLFDPITNSVYAIADIANSLLTVLRFDASSGTLLGRINFTQPGGYYTISPLNGHVWLAYGLVQQGQTETVAEYSPDGTLIDTFTKVESANDGPYLVVADKNGNAYMASGPYIVKTNRTTHALDTVYTTATSIIGMVYDPDRNSLWVHDSYSGILKELSLGNFSLVQSVTADIASTSNNMSMFYDPYRTWIVTFNGARNQITAFNTSDLSVAYTGVSPQGTADIPNGFSLFWASPSPTAFWINDSSTNYIYKIAFSSSGKVAGLKEIIQDLSLRVGLKESEIDVSNIKQGVVGFSVTSRMPARSAIRPLADAFFFDSVESQGTIKFVPRGGASALSISAHTVVGKH